MDKREEICYPAPDHAQNTLLDALGSIGVDGSRENRARIAARNGMPEYSDQPEQDWKLLRLLRAGKLKRI